MKTVVVSSPSIASEGIQKSVMGMSASGMSVASFFLRDKIYSDKAKACIREYVCNAIDEHKKHNIQKTIEVKLHENDGVYLWSVRDFALGLDDNGVRNIFGMYFESTKSKSNDSIGGFGIGSKAAHCYTDTFFIKSYHNGKLTHYACVLGGGERGVPVGEIYELSSEDTTEQGIEISFEIKSNAMYEFNKKTFNLIRSLPDDIDIEYDVNAPSLNYKGVAVPVKTKASSTFVCNNKTYKISSLEESISHDRTLALRMGGIIYEFRSSASIIGYNTEFSANGIVVDVPIGELSIPISRESFESTPSNQAIFQQIYKAIKDLRESEIKKIPFPSMVEFMKIANGTQIETDFFNFEARRIFPQHTNAISMIWTSGNYYHPRYSNYINADGACYTIYILPDSRTRNQWQNRLHAFLKENNPSLEGGLVFSEDSLETFKKSLLDNKIDDTGIDYKIVKELGLPPMKKSASSGEPARYVVYLKGDRLGAYTAEEYEKKVESVYGKIKKGWWKDTTSLSELNRRTVALASYPDYAIPCITVKSERMYSNLLELGWIAYAGESYTAMKDEFIKQQKKRDEEEKIKNQLLNLFGVVINSKAVNYIIKKPHKLGKFIQLRQKINDENTLRSRIINSMQKTGSLARSDLRQILSLDK